MLKGKENRYLGRPAVMSLTGEPDCNQALTVSDTSAKEPKSEELSSEKGNMGFPTVCEELVIGKAKHGQNAKTQVTILGKK